MIDYDENVDITKLGISALVYSATGAGKTGSVITCPDPIWLISTEEKDPRLLLELLGCKKKVKISAPEGFDDLLDTLNEKLLHMADFPFKTIFFDGLSFSQSNFKTELEDARKDVRVQSSDYRGMVDRTRLEKPDWDVLGSLMIRSTRVLTSFTKYGVHVICTAIEDQGYKKYGGGVKITPYFQGFSFGRLVHGLFDFMGYIINPFHYENDKPVLPRIAFASKEDSERGTFMARSSSAELTRVGEVPLHWEKIIKFVQKKAKGGDNVQTEDNG